MKWERLPRAAQLAAVAYIILFIGFAISLVLIPDRAGDGLRNLCQWDCVWYRSIAERGYDVVPDPSSLQANFGFYPAFPLAVRGVMTVIGLDFTHAALLLNAVYTLLFAWLALSSREELLLRSDRDAAIFLLVFFLSPWSFFGRIPYTEMQFNLALLATFIAWRRGAFVAAATFGVVLTATRVTGVFLPIALLIELLIREKWRIVELLKAPDGRFRALAMMPLGAIAFFFYLGFHVGDPLANFRVQSVGWDHPARNPIESLIEGVTSLDYFGLTSVGAFSVTCVALILGTMRGRVPLPLALMGLGIVGMSTVTGLLGLPRYALAIFLVYLVVPALSRRGLLILLAIFVPFQIVFVILYVLRDNGVL